MKTNLFLGVEGWLSICVAHLLSTLSSVKLNLSGRFSISNKLLFGGVTVLLPNEASITSLIRQIKKESASSSSVPASAAGVEEATKNRKKIKGMQKRKLQQLSEESKVNYTTVSGEVLMERISALKFDEIESSRGLLVPLHAKNYPMGLKLWDRMDYAWVLSISCLVAIFGIQWWTGLFRTISTCVLRKHQQSPGDWKLELQEQREDSGRLLILLLLFMTFSQLILLGWTCSDSRPLASRPKLLGGQIPFFSFVIGLSTGLFTLSFSYSSNSLFDEEGTQSLFQLMGIQFQSSMEELAARIILFSRIIHPTILNNAELEAVATICKVFVTVLISLIATMFCTPVLETWHILVPLFLTDNLTNSTKDNHQKSTHHQAKRRYMRFAIVSIGILPLLYLASYVLAAAYGQEQYMGMFRVAYALVFFSFIVSILNLCLQKHCKDAITDVITGPLRQKEFTSDDILVPFRRQFQTLVPTASNLSCFPLFVLLLLTCAQYSLPRHNHPCGIHIYPDIHSNLVDEANSCFHTTTTATTKSKKLPPKECWIEPTPTYDWITANLFTQSPKYELPANTDDCCGSHSKITASVLLQHAPQPKITLYSLLLINDGDKDETQPCTGTFALRILWNYLLEHKILTNSVLFPIIEVVSFMSCAMWVVLSLPVVGIYIWSIQSHRNRNKNKKA